MLRSSAIRIALAALLLLAQHAVDATASPQSVAFYYGAQPPWRELAAFDWVVVEPDVAGTVPRNIAERTEVFAYLSIGEVNPARSWAGDVPASWRLGMNPDWGSAVVDLSAEGWPRFVVERVIRPLWAAGYRGFFLDTLDSWRIVTTDADAQAAQRAGLVKVIRAIRDAFPDAKLFLNRGFEILPEVHGLVAAVAAESLYRGWDPRERRYREVEASDRAALLAELERVRDDYRLPVVAIDYLPPEERSTARSVADRIRAHGFTPWVSTPALDMLGVGSVEVMPRRVLVLHDAGGEGVERHPALRYAAMPINHLGYIPEYVDLMTGALPEGALAGRYAGIVLWPSTSDDAYTPRLAPLLARAMREGVRVAVLGRFGVPVGREADAIFGTRSRAPGEPTRLEDRLRDPRVAFEIAPLADRRDFFPLAAANGVPWLRYENERGETMDAISITPWGGYALAPYDVITLPGGRGARWVVDPFAFLTAALALPAMPVPDATTETGRRLLVIQFDDTGYETPSDTLLEPAKPRAQPAFSQSGSIITKRILDRYRFPTSISGTRAPASLFSAPHTERIDDVLPEWNASDVLTRANASVTLVPPLGVARDGGFRVFAAARGDAAYTNGWTGPPSAYERVIEAFTLAGTPRRLAPVHIRYQARSATRRASLAALDRVYAWALDAGLHPIFASAYAAKLADFDRTVIARTPDGWRVRNAGDLRTLRVPVTAGIPDRAASSGVAGYERFGDTHYVHVTTGDTIVRLAERPTGGAFVANANGRVIAFAQDESGFTAEISSAVPLTVELEAADGCNVRFYGTGTPIATRRERRTIYESGDPDGGRATIVCR